jgi:hypothetical protein
MADVPENLFARMFNHIVGKAADSTERDARTVGVAMLFALGIGTVAIVCWNPPFWAAALLWASASTAFGMLLGFLFGIPRVLSKTGAPPSGGQNGQGANGQKGQKGGANTGGQAAVAAPAGDQNNASLANNTPPGADKDNGSGHLDGTQKEADKAGQAQGSTGVNTNLEEISDWLTKIIVGVSLVELQAGLAQLEKAAQMIAQALGGKSQESFAYALMVYFSISGFLGSYLLTRLYLQKAFREAGSN